MAPKKPRKSDAELTAVRLPAALLKRIDKWQIKSGAMNRSDAIRMLINAGLDAKEAPIQPEWMARLEEIAGRYGQSIDGCIQILADGLEDQEEPTPPAKPKRGMKLRSWIT